MPADPTKKLRNFFSKKSSESEGEKFTDEAKNTESVVEELERSLTKEDNLIEPNIFNEDDRKNSKNKEREKEKSIQKEAEIQSDTELKNEQEKDHEEGGKPEEDGEADGEGRKKPKAKKRFHLPHIKFPGRSKKHEDEQAADDEPESPKVMDDTPPTDLPSPTPITPSDGEHITGAGTSSSPVAPSDDGVEEEDDEANIEQVEQDQLLGAAEAAGREDEVVHEDDAVVGSPSPDADLVDSDHRDFENRDEEQIPEHVVPKPKARRWKHKKVKADAEVKSHENENVVEHEDSQAKRKPKPKRRWNKAKRSKPTSQATSEEVVDEAADDVIADQASDDRLEHDHDTEVMEELAEESREEDDSVLAVTIHYSDHLQADLHHMSHPIVRTSIVDPLTGCYWNKSNSARPVTSYYESDEVGHVMPVLTQPFDFYANKSYLPRWEETLIFNESYASLTSGKRLPPPADATDTLQQTPIVFFVIRDFLSMAKANNQRRGNDTVDRGWYNVAWGFLKLVGAHGKPNTGHQVRLQLFHPPRGWQTTGPDRADQLTDPVYQWWHDHPRVAYHSTLYVTLKAVQRPSEMDPARRSMFATQPECGLESYDQLGNDLEFADGSDTRLHKPKPKWSRLPGQDCRLPNSISLRLWAGTDGAFTVRFSHDGLLLAVACKHEATFPVLLYAIPDGEEMGLLRGHQQLVYDIQWSADDKRLVTASGDGTAQVWELKDKSKPSHTLSHPAYVYTAAFHPTAQHIVATAGYDAVVRVWSAVAGKKERLLQELDAHKSLVNSISFDLTGLTLYSADNSGLIVAWNCPAHNNSGRKERLMWAMKKKFEERELGSICINSIQMHPRNNNKLLLHCRNSLTRMLDVRIHSLMSYTGAVCNRHLLRSTITPCGSFVISGSEDGCAYVWNADTGDQVANYNELTFPRAVRDVTFHPHDHLVAFCCFAQSMPVLVYKYSVEAAAQGIQLVSSENDMERSGVDVRDRRSTEVTSRRPTTSRVSKIQEQLDTVLPQHSDDAHRNTTTTYLHSPRRHLQSVGVPYDQRTSLSTWGSTFDTYTQAIEPSYLSPHAPPEARLYGEQYARTQPNDETTTTRRRTNFSAVGGSPYRITPEPLSDLQYTMDSEGNASFKMATISRDGHEVVALYDYQANRSDELTIAKGDVIKVIYKDGPTWWFGQLLHSDGQQGYFPSNYVTTASDDNEDEAGSKLKTTVTDIKQDDDTEAAGSSHDTKLPESSDQHPQDDDQIINEVKSAIAKLQKQRPATAQQDSAADPGVSIASLSSSRGRRRAKREGDDATVDKKRDEATSATQPVVVTEQSVRAAEEAQRVSSAPPGRRRVLPTPPPKKPAPRPIWEADDTKQASPRTKPPIARPAPENTSQQLEATRSRDDATPTAKLDVTSLPNELTPQRPQLGILRAVQAKLLEKPDLSDTMLDGARDRTLAPSSGGALQPIMTSTAVKKKKKRDSSFSRDERRRRRKLQNAGAIENDENDAIPMLRLDSSRPDVDGGASNAAYDDVTDAV